VMHELALPFRLACVFLRFKVHDRVCCHRSGREHHNPTARMFEHAGARESTSAGEHRVLPGQVARRGAGAEAQSFHHRSTLW
jgi:hypothetical protein